MKIFKKKYAYFDSHTSNVAASSGAIQHGLWQKKFLGCQSDQYLVISFHRSHLATGRPLSCSTVNVKCKMINGDTWKVENDVPAIVTSLHCRNLWIISLSACEMLEITRYVTAYTLHDIHSDTSRFQKCWKDYCVLKGTILDVHRGQWNARDVLAMESFEEPLLGTFQGTRLCVNVMIDH